LLVLDAEALLLVDDEEAEILESDVGLEERVGPDHDVDLALGGAQEDVALLLRRAEPRERLDADRVLGESLPERVQVLLDQDRGRREDGDLLPVLDRLEGGADRDLGLAVADVAAEEAVHRAARLHVALDVGGGLALVRRVLVEEAGFHLLLPARVGREGETLGHLPGGVELEELGRHLPDRRLGLAAEVLPRLAADLVELGCRRLVGVADPALDQVEAVYGHAQRFAARILDGEDLDLLESADLDPLETLESSDPVVEVDDVV